MLPKRRLTKVKTTKFAAVANQSLRILKVNPRDFSQVFWGDAKSQKKHRNLEERNSAHKDLLFGKCSSKTWTNFSSEGIEGKKSEKKIVNFHTFCQIFTDFC